ncbi:MAG: hypothetical protein IJ167_06310 [Lachnospiraceae bacterium]|nr:hypothetical protein [Lachnospiraceae bacterium]
MSDSIISMFFLGVLGVLFILLVVLTIVLIVTRKKGDEEEYDEYEDDISDTYDDGEYDESYAGENEEEYDESYAGGNEEEYDDYQDESGYDEDTVLDEVNNDSRYDDAQEKENVKDDAYTDAEKDNVEDNNTKIKNNVSDIYEDEDNNDSNDENESDEENVYSDELGDYSDSAFAPYKEEEGLYNEEAIMASVKEAEAMSEAVIYGKNETEAMFGISDELDSYKKKPVKKSTVSSTDEFYWYNKMDVAEKPSYKTKEMYYHYFNLPKDCIEDLLVEMYDCALVRTEEIRYIAYGIEPKAVSIKDILSEGNYYYSDQPKKKEPMPQDLIKIYEKWCGYVDKLFDKVEIHADEFTIQEIRKMLCEFGRNDVDVILEGK